MARMVRFKMEGEAAAYHLYGRIAGMKGEYSLTKPLCRKTLIPWGSIPHRLRRMDLVKVF